MQKEANNTLSTQAIKAAAYYGGGGRAQRSGRTKPRARNVNNRSRPSPGGGNMPPKNPPSRFIKNKRRARCAKRRERGGGGPMPACAAGRYCVRPKGETRTSKGGAR